MTAPNLETPEGRTAYRAELKTVGRQYRIAGFVLILLGAAGIMSTRLGWLPEDQTMLVVAYGALAAGWALFVTATFLRTRHHKRRMAEGL